MAFCLAPAWVQAASESANASRAREVQMTRLSLPSLGFFFLLAILVPYILDDLVPMNLNFCTPVPWNYHHLPLSYCVLLGSQPLYLSRANGKPADAWRAKVGRSGAYLKRLPFLRHLPQVFCCPRTPMLASSGFFILPSSSSCPGGKGLSAQLIFCLWRSSLKAKEPHLIHSTATLTVCFQDR